jgi:hypothetical protein
LAGTKAIRAAVMEHIINAPKERELLSKLVIQPNAVAVFTDSDDFESNREVQLIVMKTIICLLTFSVILLAADDPRKPDDCCWENKSKALKLVKTRSAGVGKSYINNNDGKPITVAEWYKLTCSLDAKVPNRFPPTHRSNALKPSV